MKTQYSLVALATLLLAQGCVVKGTSRGATVAGVAQAAGGIALVAGQKHEIDRCEKEGDDPFFGCDFMSGPVYAMGAILIAAGLLNLVAAAQAPTEAPETNTALVLSSNSDPSLAPECNRAIASWYQSEPSQKALIYRDMNPVCRTALLAAAKQPSREP